MRVFISWSKSRSKAVAHHLREWLPYVINRLQPWMSKEDIDKGARWSQDIAGELAGARVGIICLTRENLDSPWIHFEAGALSKTLDRTLVCPYLFGVEPTDVRGPLVQFQATRADHEDTRQLLYTINSALGDERLDTRQLDRAFDKWWPELAQALASVEAPHLEDGDNKRPDRDLLEEILDRIRKQDRAGQLRASLARETSSDAFLEHLLRQETAPPQPGLQPAADADGGVAKGRNRKPPTPRQARAAG